MSEYDLFAPVYDTLLYLPLKGIRKKITEIVLKEQPNLILDLCCGTGDQLINIEKSGQFNGDLIGIDLSESMLNIARKKSKLNFQIKDATDTTFPNEMFDLVITSFALHEKSREDSRKIVLEANRVLKSGGKFIIGDYHLTSNTFIGAKLLIHLIERIAGKSHYTYFRNYLNEGQLFPLMEGFHLSKEYPNNHLGAAVWFFIKE